MITNHDRHLWQPARLRTGIGTAFVLAVLGLSGCGGGGGHGNGGGGQNEVTLVQVSAVSPQTGPFIGGTLLSITGVHFKLDESQRVLVGGRVATDVTVIDENTITCRTPAGTPGAKVEVVVGNSLGEGRLVDGFSYLPLPPARSDVNGDGIGDLVISAPLDDSAGTDAGAVFVFFGSEDPLALLNATAAQANVKLVGRMPGDSFGTCVCAGDVDGDGHDDLVVGANRVDSVGSPDVGAVYVFKGPLQPSASLSAVGADIRLVGETAVAGDRFGTSVEVADLTGDDKADIMVGAAMHDAPGRTDAGCVYLFRGGATLTSRGAELADMTFDGADINEQIGTRVTCGDLNGDGALDVVLASPLADPVLPPYIANGGKVYVVFGGTTLNSRMVSASDVVLHGVAAEDRFGSSAAVKDVNADGIDDLLVGAPGNDALDADAGRVYVFFGRTDFTGGSANLASVMLSGLPTHNSFGRSLRTGDVDGDGIADILVGAPDADYLNDGNGRGYLFLGSRALSDRVAIQADAIFNGEILQGEALGTAVSLIDLNGDGFADPICTSSQHATGSGRAYVWMGGNGTMVGAHQANSADVIYSGVQSGAQFGMQVIEGY